MADRYLPWAQPRATPGLVFRHNRRNQPMAAFQTLLGLGTRQKSTAYGRIRGALDLAKTAHHG